MPGIWSKAAQFQGCRGRAYYTTKTCTIVRQSTRPTTRRRVRASDVFTACYTSIMATAAVLDAGNKDLRRQDLDRQIAEARSNLAKLREESSARDLSSPAPTAWAAEALEMIPQGRVEAFKSICAWHPDSLLEQQQLQQQRKRAICELRRFLGNPQYSWIPAGQEANLIELAKVGEMLAVEELDPDVPQREPSSEVQMGKASKMLEDLVRSLLEEVYRGQDERKSLDSGWTAVRMLESDGYPRYKNPHVNTLGCMQTRHQLNESNRRIMERWDLQRRGAYVTKICFNLLVSEYLPGIQNYNTLILGFTQLGEHELARIVVDSFLFKSHLLPTHTTVLSLLHHYRLKKDIVGFYALVCRLVAYDPRGLGIRRRRVGEVLESKDIRAWAKQSDVSVWKGFVTERVKMDLPILEAMMQGFLELDALVPAAKVFVICLREGYEVGRKLLSSLFQACIANLDFNAARILLQGLERSRRFTKFFLNAKYPWRLQKLQQVLRLCEVQYLPAGTRDLRLVRLSSPLAPLCRTRIAVWIRMIEHELRRWSTWIAEMEQSLQERGSQLIEQLEEGIIKMNLLMDYLDGQERSLLRFGREAEIFRLQQDILKSEETALRLHEQVSNVTARTVPRHLRRVTLYEAKASREERLDMHLDTLTPGTRLHQAAACFDMSQKLDKTLKWAILDALPLSMAERIWGNAGSVDELDIFRLQNIMLRYLVEFDGGRLVEEPVLDTALEEQVLGTSTKTHGFVDPFQQIQRSIRKVSIPSGVASF